MSGETRKPPLGLDMNFGEALVRFAGTDREEVLEAEQGGPVRKTKKRDTMATWSKRLSRTDAQQETKGGIVPYLRLTKSSLTTQDFQTWFRTDFFAAANWQAGTFGKENVEQATIPFAVSINGVLIGTQDMLITHGDARQDSHNTPNTWLHWSNQLQHMLEINDLSGRTVTLTRGATGAFSLDI
jgi:hypothetical protein